ncbi:MAG: transporter substrate-binding domain-containing protein [Methylococcaceae bacterium]
MNAMIFAFRPVIVLLLVAISFCGISHAEESGFRATLTDEEKAWLADHPVIRYAPDPKYAPIEFVDRQGQYAGMAADYLKLVTGRLGIRLIQVPVKSWAEALVKARTHEADLLPATVDTVQRREYLLFATPHIFIPTVLITARYDLGEMPFDEMVRSLKVAVVQGNSWEERLTLKYPEAQLIEAPDDESALEMVSYGVADVMIGTLVTATYYISKNNITNLLMVRSIEPTTTLSMAVRNDWPMLRDLLNKALANLTEDEKRAIDVTWMQLPLPAWWHNRTYQLTAVAILGTLLTIIIATLAWNRALAHKVRSRTLALEEAHLRLVQSAKLESVGRLAAGIAHEVKNPLAIIQMGLDYLAADIPKEGEGYAVIADMEDAIQRADTVIKGLLDFAREKKLDMRPTDINEVLKASLKLVHHELIQYNITVQQCLAPDLPKINADPNKLEQVFINLFMNAIQAMGRDGKLTVTSEAGKLKQLIDLPSHDKAKFTASEHLIRLKVEDTGPGIDPTKLGKVFDPFFTTKPAGEGTGLGLSVSRAIVELHQGTISLSNRGGGGASVVLLFKTESGA